MHANRKNWLLCEKSALPFEYKPTIKSVRHESSDRDIYAAPQFNFHFATRGNSPFNEENVYVDMSIRNTCNENFFDPRSHVLHFINSCQ